jgi:hypothetical protein
MTAKRTQHSVPARCMIAVGKADELMDGFSRLEGGQDGSIIHLRQVCESRRIGVAC